LLGYNLPLFILLAAITRGARFFLVAAALNAWGDKLRPLIEKHFPLFIFGVLALAVVGIFVAAKVL
jgi:hypothetical protein